MVVFQKPRTGQPLRVFRGARLGEHSGSLAPGSSEGREDNSFE